MMENNTLTIKRTSDWINRFFKNTVIINGKVEGKIASGQTLRFQLAGDRHELSVGGTMVEVDFADTRFRTLIVKTNVLSKIIFTVFLLLFLSTAILYLYLKFEGHQGARYTIALGAFIILAARYLYKNKIDVELH